MLVLKAAICRPKQDQNLKTTEAETTYRLVGSFSLRMGRNGCISTSGPKSDIVIISDSDFV